MRKAAFRVLKNALAVPVAAVMLPCGLLFLGSFWLLGRIADWGEVDERTRT